MDSLAGPPEVGTTLGRLSPKVGGSNAGSPSVKATEVAHVVGVSTPTKGSMEKSLPKGTLSRELPALVGKASHHSGVKTPPKKWDRESGQSGTQYK